MDRDRSRSGAEDRNDLSRGQNHLLAHFVGVDLILVLGGGLGPGGSGKGNGKVVHAK